MATAGIIYDADPKNSTEETSRRRRYKVWEGTGRYMSVTRGEVQED